jgi:UDP:flavonoid glycosyltransferase YjiC (YdhE family)
LLFKPDRLRAPLPHDEIMPSASLVIGHSGHSTTMRALAHGVPLLILPMHRVLDQTMIGKEVAAAGAGMVLQKTASTAEIRGAVRKLLEDPSFRHAAAVSARLRSRNGAIAAADEVEGLLKVHKKSAQPAASAIGQLSTWGRTSRGGNL